MITLITPQLKDAIIRDILSVGRMSVQCDMAETAKEQDTTPDIIESILDQFEEVGLISQCKLIGYKTNITVKAKLHDVFRNGGFTAQEEILKENINKLGLEIELLSKQLSPDLLDEANKIAGIGSAIMSALPLFQS